MKIYLFYKGPHYVNRTFFMKIKRGFINIYSFFVGLADKYHVYRIALPLIVVKFMLYFFFRLLYFFCYPLKKNKN